MFNFLNKGIGLFHTKPTVGYLQPKTINVYFKNAVKPKHILLNINHYDVCELDIIQENKDNTNYFMLVADLKGQSSTVLTLGVFESRKEAEEALLVLRNKLFGLDKKLVKFTSMILVIVVLLGLITDLSGNVFGKLLGNQQVAQSGNYTLPPNANPSELLALQNQLIANNQEATQRTNSTPMPAELQQAPTQATPVQAPTQEQVPSVEVSGNPDVNNLVNSLGK